MVSLITALGWLASALAALGAAYAGLGAVLVGRVLKPPRRRAETFPAVSLIKPLHRDSGGLKAALESFCKLDYPGQVQIVFGVQDDKDPAIAVVRALQAAHVDLDITLVVEPRLHGINRKVSNLINIDAHVKHEILVLSDADIHVGSDYLRVVTAELEGMGVGAVSCLYVGDDGDNAWSSLSAMAINYQFLPNAVVGQALGMAEPCFGSTIAITRKVLAQIGGFQAFANDLADDYEMGQAVRAKGYHIAMPPMVVAHACTEADGRELIDHELRWARTIRQIDGLGHAGSFVTHAFPMALIAAALLAFSTFSLSLIFAVFLMRLALKLRIDAVTGARAGRWWLIPVRDVLSFAIFLASFAVNTVGWQGRRYRVGPDGALSHL